MKKMDSEQIGSFFPFEYYLENRNNLSTFFTKDESNRTEQAFAKNIKVEKNAAIYNAHSYHTKIPPDGIVPYIKHYTNTGDTVLDPFCGSGMTGVAVKMLCASKGGKRNILLNDISTAACHIAYNHINAISPQNFRSLFESMIEKVKDVEDELYTTWHCDLSWKDIESLPLEKIRRCKKRYGTNGEYINLNLKGNAIELVKSRIIYTIWSETYDCPNKRNSKTCGHEIVLWDTAKAPNGERVGKSFACPKCKKVYTRKTIGVSPRSKPVLINYQYFDRKIKKYVRGTRKPYKFDFDKIAEISSTEIKFWYPDQPILQSREMMTMGPAKLGVRCVSDFYTRRNLIACASIWDQVMKLTDIRMKQAMAFACTNTFWHATKMRRYNTKGGMRPLTGTLYIPQLSAECNVFDVLRNKIDDLVRYYSLEFQKEKIEAGIINFSATDLSCIPDNSIDYIFTDPPFGGNIYYSDCSLIWEGWLNSFTDEKDEIHFNRVRKPENGGKTRDDYKILVKNAFLEMYRYLKNGRWASIVFNNSDDDVLQTFIEAADSAGFEIKDVCFLDKEQKSVKGYMGRAGTQNVTNCDFVLNLFKPLPNAKIRMDTHKSKSVSDPEIENLIGTYLGKLPEWIEREPEIYTNEHRTTPFLHSMIVRTLIKQNRSLIDIGIKRIKDVCEKKFYCSAGAWYLKKNEFHAQSI
ncbi:MAG: hypothetical protein HQK54_06685 [Oligoflexales bacterium]|nr:hypothetical protein [Oligoflexales bacterium]